MFANKWLTSARANRSENEQLNDQGMVRRLSKLTLTAGTLGQQSIGLLTVDDWETAFRQLQTLAASTKNKYRQAVLTMQDWGVEKGYLTRPWLTGKVIKKGGTVARQKGARRDRRLIPDVLDPQGKIKTPGEERRLMAAASPWLQRLIIGAVETGCRRGELLSLQWGDVSLSRRQLTIRAEKAKTRTMRQVPISPRLLAVLKLLQLDPAGKELPARAYVFGNTVGEELPFQRKAWTRALKDAGIDDLEFRDLRHEAGSRMVEAGWSLHHVQRMLGHEDVKTTSIYLNATFNDLQDAMDRFGTGHALHDVAPRQDSDSPTPVQGDDPVVANVTVN